MSTPKRKQAIIIIADADEDERSLLKAVVKLSGYKVIEATDGRELFELARAQRPDLLVIDLTLPCLLGADTIQKIRRQESLRYLPIVAVSSEETAISLERSSGRSTIHLIKPIEYEQLYSFIGRLLPGQMASPVKV